MKRFISVFLALLLLSSLTAVPAYAAGDVNGEIAIIRRGYTGRTYDSYVSQSIADENPITVYANSDDFPIRTEQHPFGNYSVGVEDITTYGVHRIQWENYFGYGTYATVLVEPYPPKPSSSKEYQSQQTPTQDPEPSASDILIKQINIPYFTDWSPYAAEIEAYYADEWDGSVRTQEDDGQVGGYAYRGLISSRWVDSRRTYHWSAIDTYTGDRLESNANIDYCGYKEVIPASDHSLAVSYKDGIIEQWRHFEQLGAWDLDAGGNIIDSICSFRLDATAGGNSADEPICRGVVILHDASGDQCTCILMSDNTVQKVWCSAADLSANDVSELKQGILQS